MIKSLQSCGASYRSQAGVSRWVSIRVCGLSFALLCSSFNWTFNSSGGLVRFGAALHWIGPILTSVPTRRSHSDAGHWNVLAKAARCRLTWLRPRRVESLSRSWLKDSSCSKRKTLKVTGRWHVVRTREFTDQVFDAPNSVQVGPAGHACRCFLLTGSLGLVWFSSTDALLTDTRELGWIALKCVLKKVKRSITDPNTTVLRGWLS